MSEKSRTTKSSRRVFRQPPPAYSPRDEGPDSATSSRNAAGRERMGPGGIEATNNMLDGRALMDEEGRIDLFLNLKDAPPPFADDEPYSLSDEIYVDPDAISVPPLNIVIFIVGSRGDVQPYLALAIRLITSHSHRVRIATHGNFKEFVLSANRFLRGKTGKRGQSLEGMLEFADAGGDPKELMSYMVKNPGLLPSLPSLFKGEVGKKRKMTAEMLRGFYRACFYPDSVNGDFAADAIISNPPAFAHVSVAEALGLPLLLTFTMPWTATRAYQHPLVNVRESNAEQAYTNYMTYALADIMVFQGLGDVINDFRTSVLGIEAISDKLGPSLIDRLRIPWTYCWNGGLLPRPSDWKGHIDISGFYFLENDSEFTPDPALAAFLESGDPPLYIGFGSVVIEDTTQTTETIIKTLMDLKVRAILHSGWAGLGKGMEEFSHDIFILSSDVPHDWLFADGRVAAVCHHGGAGTTAIGLREGVPTIIVPFFGDQPFWGHAVSRAGAGPDPIPFKELTAERLASAITFAMSPEAKEAAATLGEQIRGEDALQKGLNSFHRHLPIETMTCEVDPSRVAVWWSEEYCLRLSAAVVGVLAEANMIDVKKLKPHRSKDWDVTKHKLEPISGAVKGLVNASTTLVSGTTQLFYRPIRGFTTMTYGTLEATFAIIGDLWQGFDNVPGLVGSPVREVGKVDGIGSGFREGFKGLGFGLWDGITGLVTEPIHGGFQEGPKGVAKGFGRSYLNLMIRPCAGTLGFFVHPWRGGYYSIRNAITSYTPAITVLRGPRESASVKEAALLTPKERQQILEKWASIKMGRKAVWRRRRKIKHRRHRVFLVDKKGKKVATIDTRTGDIASPSATTSTTTTPASTPGIMSPPISTRRSSSLSSSSSPQTTTFPSELSRIEEDLKTSYAAEDIAMSKAPPPSTGEPSPTSALSPTTEVLINALKGPSPRVSKQYHEEPLGESSRSPPIPRSSSQTTYNDSSRAKSSVSPLDRKHPPLPNGVATDPKHESTTYHPPPPGWRGGPIEEGGGFRFAYQSRREERLRRRESSLD